MNSAHRGDTTTIIWLWQRVHAISTCVGRPRLPFYSHILIVRHSSHHRQLSRSIACYMYLAAVNKCSWRDALHTLLATLLVSQFSYLLTCAWPLCFSHTSRCIARGTRLSYLSAYVDFIAVPTLFRYIARCAPSYSFTWWYISDCLIHDYDVAHCFTVHTHYITVIPQNHYDCLFSC